MKRHLIFTLAFLLILIGWLFGPQIDSAFAAWEDAAGRAYWCEIVIQYGQVDATLSDYPVLLTEVNFPDGMKDSDLATACQNGGGDIRFSSTEPTAVDGTGATQIALEVVSFVTNATPASATAEIHVPVASLSSVGATTIYAAWGTSGSSTQPAIDSTFGAENVWNSAYKMVHHMEDATTSITLDSTDNDNDGTKGVAAQPPVTSSGKFGDAQDFDGNNDGINTPGESDFDASSRIISTSVWIKTTDEGTADIVSKGGYTGGYNALAIKSDKILVNTREDPAADAFYRYSSDTINDGDWHNIVSVINCATKDIDIYIDGALNQAILIGSDSCADNDAVVTMGWRNQSTGLQFDGILDEVKISNIERTSTWISTEHNNQDAPATFAIEGAIQEFAVGSTPQVIIINFY